MHRLRVNVGLAHTDAAGVVFQAEYFRLFHDAYEDFLARAGFPIAKLLAQGRVGLPVVHAEADFRTPLRVGDRLSIELRVEEVASRRYAIGYRARCRGRIAATGRTVHVAIALPAGKACAIPAGLARMLRRHAAPAR